MELSISTSNTLDKFDSEYILNDFNLLQKELIETDPLIQQSEKESISIFDLEIIKSKIETMSKTQHIEVLKILKKYPSIKLNENKNGIYINLSFLLPETIIDLKTYINYIYEQEHSLNVTETVKNDIKKSFFI